MTFRVSSAAAFYSLYNQPPIETAKIDIHYIRSTLKLFYDKFVHQYVNYDKHIDTMTDYVAHTIGIFS